MRRILVLFFTCIFMLSSVFAGGAKEDQTSAEGGLSGTLTVATNASSPTYDAVEHIVELFMEENPGVEVEYTTYGSDYENLMKARMAANDLPDVFATHGWAVNRYAEYLRPLNDLELSKRISPSIVDTVTTDSGDIVAMPITSEQSGMIYNKEILAKAGWDHVPATLDEFYQCCEDVKALGVIPVYITGKDTRNQANLMDIMAVSFLITCNDSGDNADRLYDGTFDWSKWAPVSTFLSELVKRGYTNVDATTADPIYTAEKLAFGEAMFNYNNQAAIADAWTLNPDAELSMMPVPGLHEDDEQIWIGGERECYGIWKDSPNMELAIALLEFMARPENVKYVCEVAGMPSGFADVSPELRLTPDFEAFSDLKTYPYFDREWLPSGMWATMRTIGGALTAGEMSIEESCKTMHDSYLSLMAQQ